MIKALNDLLCADNNLAASVIPFDMVCFHCQQAAEKFLKAFLVRRGRSYPFSHDLLLLLEMILEIQPDAENLREDLTILMPYAIKQDIRMMFGRLVKMMHLRHANPLKRSIFGSPRNF